MSNKEIVHSIPIPTLLRKAIIVGLKVKTPFSLLMTFLSIPAAFLPLCISRLLQTLTDQLFEISADHNILFSSVNESLLLLGGSFLLQLFFTALIEYATISDRYLTQTYIREYVLSQICSVHYSYIENRDDFLKKIEFADHYASEEMARNIQTIFLIIQQFITFASIAVTLWDVHPVVVIVLLITSIPSTILSYKQADETFRRRTKWSEEGHLAIHFFHLCTSSDLGIQEVRHYELFDYLKARWRAVADNYIHQKNQLVAKHLKYNLAADFLRSGVYLAILLLTAWQIYQNPALGLGLFTLVYTLSDRLQNSLATIVTEIMQFSASLSYLQEFFSLENLERDEPESIQHTNTSSPHVKGDIRFENVSFTYPDSNAEVLHNISVSIHAGEKIAIVGDNGSGKSTFISLLTGMFVPDSGKILIDGKNMETHKHDIRQNISVIFQDYAHYEASLRDNITVSDRSRSLTDSEILDLAKQINVDDVITEQPDGLDSMLGHLSQKGNDLSGGQWQKIALLRAVYRDKASIMILDEPTAALDPLAEAQLYRDFSQITGERTTLLISHRLGITSLVDRVLVFHDGRIIEDGTHQELMKNKGHYYSMYLAQAQWYQEK